MKGATKYTDHDESRRDVTDDQVPRVSLETKAYVFSVFFGASHTRRSKLGISLLSCLISILLLTGLVLVLQSQMLATSFGNKALVKGIESDSFESSVKALLSPSLVDVFLTPSLNDNLHLNGTPMEFFVLEKAVTVRLQDVDGLVDVYRTDVADAQKYLSSSDFETLMAMRDKQQLEIGLRQSLARVGASEWLSAVVTDRSSQNLLVRQNLSILLAPADLPNISPVNTRSPKLLIVAVE